MSTIDREPEARAARLHAPSLQEIFWGPLANRIRRIAQWRKRGALGKARAHARRAMRFEPLEPRLLLSADLTPEIAAAMSVGFDQFQFKLNSFLEQEALLDSRVPLLLDVKKNENDVVVDEAPTIRRLVTVPVDINNNDAVDGDESALVALDTFGGGDGEVSVDEFLEGWFFEPMRDFLDSVEPGDGTTTQDFVDYLEDDARDKTLDNLPDGYEISFTLINSQIDDTTEDPDAEVTFNLGFSLTVTHDMPIDLGVDADARKLLPFTGPDNAPEPPQVTVDSTMSFGFTFGVFTGGQEPGDITGGDFFIRKADPIAVNVTSDETGLDFKLNVGFLGAKVEDGAFYLKEGVETTLLDPNDPAVLGFDESQRGVEETSGIVIAANPVSDADLAHDAGFFLRVGNIGVTKAIDIVADDNSGNLGNLLDDIQSALGTAGLGDIIDASLQGGDTVRLALVDTTNNALGFDNESLSLDGTLTAAAPATLEPGSTVKFLLSVAGALPVLVSVRFPDPARDKIGFGTTQNASLPALVAQSAASGTGTIGGDSTATLTIRVTESGGGVTDPALNVTEGLIGANPNTTAGELVDDLNTAINATALNGKVSASLGGDGKIVLNPLGTTSAIEITAVDAETQASLGFVVNQESTLRLTAAGPVLDPTLDDGDPHTNDEAHIEITVTTTIETRTEELAIAPGGADGAALATAISLALSGAGFAIDASFDGTSIVLDAQDASVLAFDINTVNDDIDELIDDVNRALEAVDLDGVVTVSDSGGGVLQLSTPGGESLEISSTLTFDAGVTFDELFYKSTSELFSPSTSADSKATLDFPVSVLPGLRDPATDTHWDPADVAIVGNFDPFGVYSTFDEGEQRFNLQLTVDPLNASDPAISPAPHPVDLEGEDDAIKLVNFAELLQFNVVAAEGMIGLISQLGQALEGIGNAGQFSLYGIPFSAASLSHMLVYGDLVQTELVYDYGADGKLNEDAAKDNNDADLTDEGERSRLFLRTKISNDGEDTIELLPSFVTAQQLADRLSTLLDIPLGEDGINATYNPNDAAGTSNELSYTISLRSEDRISVGVDTAFQSPFEFDVDLLPFTEFTVDTVPAAAKVTLAGRTSLDMTFGVDLDPVAPIDYSAGPDATDIADLNNQTGVDIKLERAVTGDDPVRRVFGISSDASFAVRVDGGAEVPVSLSKAALDAGDGSLETLRAALESAINGALSGATVSVSIAPNEDGKAEDRLKITLTSGGTTIDLVPDASDPSALLELGFDPEAPVAMTLTARSSAPSVYTLTDEAGFTIHVASSSLGVLSGKVGGDTAVSIAAAATAGNRTIAELVADVNNALRGTGLLVLDGDVEKGIRAGFDAGRLVLSATDTSTHFSVVVDNGTAAGAVAQDELGLADGTTNADQADLIVIDRDGTQHRVSLDSVDGGTVHDLLGALTLPGVFEAGPNATRSGLRLTDLTPNPDDPAPDTRPAIQVATVNGSLAALKLGFLNNPTNPDDADNPKAGQPARNPDFIEGGSIGTQSLPDRFFVRNGRLGGAFTMDLPGGGAAGDALVGIVGVNVSMTEGLGAEVTSHLKGPGGSAGSKVTLSELRDGAGETNPAQQIATDPSVTKLRTLNYDGQDDEFTPGELLTGDDSGAQAIILKVEDDGDSGTLTIFDVKDSFWDDEIIRGSGTGKADVDGGTGQETYFGEFQLHFAVKDGFAGNGFGPALEGALDGLTGTIPVNLTGFGGLEPDFDPIAPVAEMVDLATNLGALNDFVNLGYEHLASALEQLEGLVLTLEDEYSLLDQTLPLVNMTVRELLQVSKSFSLSVDNFREVIDDQKALLDPAETDVPTLTLQGMAQALRGAFGLADDSTGVVLDLEDGLLTIDLDLSETVSTTIGLDVDLSSGGLPNLTSGKILQVAGELGVGFKIGIDLANPDDVYLFNPEGGIDGSLTIYGNGAEDLGLVFLAQVGDVPVLVRDGLVDIDLEFSLGDLDFSGTGGRKLLSLVEFADFTADVPTESFVASIPLFDPQGGLTGFIDEITANGDLDSINLPNLSGVADALDDISSALEDFNPLDNLQLLADEVDFFFENLQSFSDLDLLNIQLPIVGSNLADGVRFIEDFRDSFITELRQTIDSATDIQVDDISDVIEDFFAGFGDGINVTDLTSQADLDNPDLTQRYAEWNFTLGDTLTVPFDLGFDIGVPSLGMSVDIPLDISVEWSVDIGIGVDYSDGAYIVLNNSTDELSLGVNIDLPSAETFGGTLGFLELIVKNLGSGVHLGFDVDLANTNGGGDHLGISDLGSLGFTPKVEGTPLYEKAVDFEMSVGIKGVATAFPNIATNFILDWELPPTPLDGLSGDALGAGLKRIALDDIRIDAGSFLNDFLGETLGQITKFTEPFEDIITALTTPIPVLTQLAQHDVTLLDLAGVFGEVDTDFIDWIETVLDVIHVINEISDGTSLSIKIGDLTLFDENGAGAVFDKSDLLDPDNSIGDLVPDVGAVGPALQNLVSSFDDALNAADPNDPEQGSGDAAGAKNALKRLRDGDLADLISFPFLDDPLQIVGLLLGHDAQLITVDAPRLFVAFDYAQSFPIFGPLAAEVGLGFQVGIDFSFGFDTYGFRRFADGGFTNPALILDGFFLGDRENITEGADINELFFEFNLSVAAELNLAIASAGVKLEGTAFIGFDLYDPDNDGAIHISELVNTIENQLRSDKPGLAPLSIFDLTGGLTLELLAFLVIDFGVFEVEYEFPITPEIEVFSFDVDFGRPPILGTDLDNGTLQLNIGPNAGDRLNGDTRDGNEEIIVHKVSNGIELSSPTLGVNTPQLYKGNFDHIIGLGGQGNDTITLSGFDNSNITFELDGGVGDDTIAFVEDASIMNPATGEGAVIRGGQGNDTLIGSHLDDLIVGGEGNDHIEGGRGYDLLFGDDGTLGVLGSGEHFVGKRVSPKDGDDTIYGGSTDMDLAEQDADDIIVGGGGEDELHGDAGRDVILGDGGRLIYEVTSGHINVDSVTPDVFTPNDMLDPTPEVTTSQKIENIYSQLISHFSGTDLGGGANDMIYGGAGGDILFGGAADDYIEGNEGDDYAVGGYGFDVIKGGENDDTLFGNSQNDDMEGNEGSDVMSGGFGDDVMHGNTGDDYMIGGRGLDVMYGDENDDEVWGEGEPDVLFGGTGNDLVVGGNGADIMFGDDGIVAKLDKANPANDVRVGIGNPALITAAMRDAADSLKGSLDLIMTDAVALDGNDIMSGNAGGDIMLGGGGDDIMGGDVDPRLAVADTPDETTETGRDVLIGDGGIVQFDRRRLQRIASIVDNDPTSFRDTIYGDNGNDVIIGGQGADGGDNEDTNVLGVKYGLAGGHGPGRGDTDPEATDDDIILGDNGELLYADDTIPGNFGRLELIHTTDTSNDTGGADTAYGEIGDDIILGGVNGSIDVLHGSVGSDVILGDNGELDFAFDQDTVPTEDDDTNLDTLDLIRSYRDGLGGTDKIYGSAGGDVLIGGTAGDEMYGDDDLASNGELDLTDVMLGDNADIFLIGTEGKLEVRVADMTQGTAVDVITTTDAIDALHPTAAAEAAGGPDTMSGNAGNDIMLGGVNNGGTDMMYGDRADPTFDHTSIADDGDDILLGDNGLLDFTVEPTPEPADADREVLDLITSFEDGLGGTDVISGNKGLDVAIGGTGGDTIYGDDAAHSANGDDLSDLLLGDNADVFLMDPGDAAAGGDLRLVLDAAVFLIRTTDEEYPDYGGSDTISGNADGDIIAGGVQGDILYGDREAEDTTHQLDGNDIILGDNGAFEWLSDGRFGDINPVDPDNIDIAANNPELYEWFTDDEDNAVADTDLTTLDLVTTEQPNNGGRDFIRGDDGEDFLFGGTDVDAIYGDDGDLEVSDATGGDDLMFGDHGRIYLHFSTLPNFNSRNFFAIDVGETDGGEGDLMWGEEGDDSMLGQQGDDRMWGGSGDDDMTGGHNVSSGWDELDAGGVIDASLNPPVNDLMDGGSGDDTMAGDNAIIWRRGDDLSPRFRDLTAATIYTTTADTITANVDKSPGNDPAEWESDPADAVGRDIQLVDHSDQVEGNAMGRYGNDVMAGGAENDVMFGELGNDLMQGDGSIDGPSDDAPDLPNDASRSIKVTDDLPLPDAYYLFNVREQESSDGDDYMEGNGGRDLMYGDLGQDDMIGGSSELFGLDDANAALLSFVGEQLRPDGSDVIFGGAGSDTARNNIGDATENSDPDDEVPDGTITAVPGGHALDADFIMGDNANVFRLVQGGADGTVPDDPADEFLVFKYDASYGGRITPRAMQQLDYTLGGADYEKGPDHPDATYVLGAADLDGAGPMPADNGAADLIHGESGDDVIFGMTGSDVIFGEGQDDDIVGGYGNDWISGGTGQDGVIGDDGLIYTSRNSTDGEPLYGVEGLVAHDPSLKESNGNVLSEEISTPGDIQIAVINVSGELKKTADLVPMSYDPQWMATDDEFYDDATNTPYADDIIFGGLGSDWLHGGSGDDAISGAEALAHAYVPDFQGGVLDLGYSAVDLAQPINPGDPVTNSNPGNVLGFNPIDTNGEHLNNRFRAGEFYLYDEYFPLRKIVLGSDGELWWRSDHPETTYEFLLNFNAGEGVFRPDGWTPGNQNQSEHYDAVYDDGKDSIFGDLGNDWLVGGTGRDNMYGGWGNDLLNADDDQTTPGEEPKHGGDPTPDANDHPDTHPYYEDRAYGGAGRDVLIGNTGGDRLIDWVGEYNSYLVPYAPFGQASVSRTMMPHLHEFLYALSAGDGADPTRFNDTGADPARNGEPDAEMGLVLQKDVAWNDQTGAPSDPQAGNIPGGKRDVLRTANMNDGTLSGFAVDTGNFSVQNATLQVSADSLGLEATAVLPLDDQLPSYYEVLATVTSEKPIAGWKANAYIVFDYFDAEDFKFAGINVSTNEVEIGYHDAAGWHVVKDAPKQLKAGTYYNMLVAINGTNVTLALNNKIVLNYSFEPRVIDDYAYGLNLGLVGIGSDNARGTFDNFTVQRVPPDWTLQQSQDFGSGTGAMFGGNETGAWTLAGGRYAATAPGASLVGLGLSRGLETDAVLELSATLSSDGAGGFVFDRYAADDYKFLVLDAEADQVMLGHVSPKGGLTVDASFAATIDAGTDYALTLRLKGTSASVNLDGQALGGFVYNAVIVDGDFGLLAERGGTSFASATVKTSDSAFYVPESAMVASAVAETPSGATLTQGELNTIADFAISQWSDALGEGSELLAALDGASFGIADLGGAELGFTEGSTVLIDADAAGWGWLVDTSPASSSEFRMRLDSNIFGAAAGSEAFGYMDLVTVVEHEVGHLLGFEHGDAGAYAVMSESLDPGVRYALEPAPSAPVTPAFDLFAGYADVGGGVSAGIDWRAEPEDGWEVKLSPYETGKPAKAASNFAPFNLDLLAKLGAQKQGAEFDSMGRALLGKDG